MTSAKHISTVDVPRGEYVDFANKAQQFFRVMKMCLQDGEWDSVLLNGVHACISMNDALTVFMAKKRSGSSNHRDAVHLLTQVLSHHTETGKNAARLSEIIDQKGIVEYESRRFTEKEAYIFAQKVERFFQWAEQLLPK